VKHKKRKLIYIFSEIFGRILFPFYSKKKLSVTFIIGSGRCGSTLLQNILNTSSSLCVIPGELNELFHSEVYPYTIKTNKKTTYFYDDPYIFTCYSLRKWKSNAERINYFILGYSILHGLNKKIIIKSAMISFMIEPIKKSFPNAKFIHIYRHPFPVISSIIKKEWPKYFQYYNNSDEFRVTAAKYWSSCLKQINIEKNTIPSKEFLEISYENLCNNTNTIISQLSSFLEVENNFSFNEITINKERTFIEKDIKDDMCYDYVYEQLSLYGYE
jgi:hypothetical protein